MIKYGWNIQRRIFMCIECGNNKDNYKIISETGITTRGWVCSEECAKKWAERHGWNVFGNEISLHDRLDKNDSNIYIFSFPSSISWINGSIKKVENKYLDEYESLSDIDKIVAYSAGAIGMILDTVITQTDILKPLDKKVAQIMRSKNIKKFQDLLDNFSNSFRSGTPAPIDFQEFKMFGPISTHAQYSFGHDPIRFIEGILQIMSGDYKGVDKFGTIITSSYGDPVFGTIQAIVSYIAHMISDFCNVQSLPYPGSTFLMEFGTDKVRKDLSTAFRSQLYNARTYIYQNIPCFVIDIIIYSYAIYDHYTKRKKIDLLVGNSKKYQTMVLISNAMTSGLNLAISGLRAGVLKDPRAIFRINFPALKNTLVKSVKYIVSD
jgi:hypothetical protein